MPFIDDALLWCPDNDGRMVDISACLQDAVSGGNTTQNQEPVSGTCELNSLDPLCNDSSDELLRQLTENPFELDNLLSDLTTDVKQEENNNNLNLQSTLNSSQNFLATCTNNSQQQHHQHQQQQSQQQNTNSNNSLLLSNNGVTINSSNGNHQQQANAESALLAFAASVSQQNHRNYQAAAAAAAAVAANNRYSIAANPLLAEKLLSPNISDLENLTIGGSRSGRPPDIKGE